MAAGYLVAQSIVTLRAVDTAALSNQMMDAGFIIVIAGFLSFVIMYVLKGMDLV